MDRGIQGSKEYFERFSKETNFHRDTLINYTYSWNEASFDFELSLREDQEVEKIDIPIHALEVSKNIDIYEKNQYNGLVSKILES